MAYRYIREWDEKRTEKAEKEQDVAEFPPTICISRKLAVGAVEIADLVAEKIGYRVVDQRLELATIESWHLDLQQSGL